MYNDICENVTRMNAVYLLALKLRTLYDIIEKKFKNIYPNKENKYV